MSNPLGEQDIIGNMLTCGDLLNTATKNFPVAKGSGLAATYVPGQVAFTANVSSNVYQTPYAEGLVMLVTLASGTASGFYLNTGSTSTNMVQVGGTGTITDTNTHAIFVSMPSAAIGSTSPAPGLPTAPFFSVTAVIPAGGCQINQLAVFAVGKINLALAGADWFSVRAGGINAVASGVTNSLDTLNPPTNLVGSGAFLVDSNQA